MKKFFIIGCLFFALSAGAQTVKWYTFEEAVALSKKEPRKIMIDVFTDWCGYCKLMDKNTFSNTIVADYLNKSYYPVKFNAEQKEDVVFDEKTFKFVAQGARGYHELAYALLNGQMSYPSLVFLNEQIQIIHVQKGYVEPKSFDEIIKFIGGDYFKTESWDNWRASYKSPFAAN
jgi:thioredoxin-related protein